MSSNLSESVEHNIPVWLTKNYMQDALRIYKNNHHLNIKEFQVMPALAKGENYGSIIFRITIHYKFNDNNDDFVKSSYIAKTSFEGDAIAASKMAPYDFFNREMQMYAEIMPKLTNILKEIGALETMFVEAIKVDFVNSAMIFADLQTAGYKMADRKLGLDITHVELALRKLANMHAATVILNQREAGALAHYDRGIFNRYTDVYKSFFVENIKACGRTLIAAPDLNMAAYGQKLLNLASVYMELGARIYDVSVQQLNVLNHGDLWTNNMMFRYNRKTALPVDVIFLDFQFVAWASPAVDLHYFFNTSLREDIRQHGQDALFQYYHQAFLKAFTAIQLRTLKIPNLHQFHIQMLDKLFYALHSSCAVQPVIFNEVTENADYNALMGVDERAIKFKNTLYQNKKVQKYLFLLLPKFERLGLLETNQ